jgi:hypothetical protein
MRAGAGDHRRHEDGVVYDRRLLRRIDDGWQVAPLGDTLLYVTSPPAPDVSPNRLLV